MLGDLLTPWILLALVLILLIYAEKWVQSHLYGVGWLLTNDDESATLLYYFFLFPGVFIHEVVQWLVAGMLNVDLKPVTAWPEPQDDGTLRYDFVQIKKETDWFRAALLGATPLIVGIVIVLFISTRILDLENVVTALGKADPKVIGPAVRELGNTPDFYLWLYVMFAISNAMLPTPADRQGWPLLMGIFAAGIGFLVLIGLGDVLVEKFTGPVAHAIDVLTTALLTVVVVEGVAIFVIGFLEEILEKTTKRKFQYRKLASEPKPRQPGSNLPLSPDTPLPSIYNLELPIPNPSKHRELAARAAKATAPAAPPSPALAAASAGEGRLSAVPERSRPGGSESLAADALTARRSSRRPGSSPVGARLRPSDQEDQPAAFRGPRTPFDKEDAPAEGDRPTGFQRPGPSPGVARQPGGLQRPTGPRPRTPLDEEEMPANDERPTGLRRSRPQPGTGSARQPGGFQQPTGARPRTPLDEEEMPANEERPTGLRRSRPRPGIGAARQPGGFQRPVGTGPRAPLGEEAPVDEDRPTGFRRPSPSPGAARQPGEFQRPTGVGPRSPLDEDRPTGFGRREVPGRSRPSSPFMLDDEDFEDDPIDDLEDENDDLEYVDFDDL